MRRQEEAEGDQYGTRRGKTWEMETEMEIDETGEAEREVARGTQKHT